MTYIFVLVDGGIMELSLENINVWMFIRQNTVDIIKNIEEKFIIQVRLQEVIQEKLQ
jgi:hypothetical protein